MSRALALASLLALAAAAPPANPLSAGKSSKGLAVHSSNGKVAKAGARPKGSPLEWLLKHTKPTTAKARHGPSAEAAKPKKATPSVSRQVTNSKASVAHVAADHKAAAKHVTAQHIVKATPSVSRQVANSKKHPAPAAPAAKHAPKLQPSVAHVAAEHKAAAKHMTAKHIVKATPSVSRQVANSKAAKPEPKPSLAKQDPKANIGHVSGSAAASTAQAGSWRQKLDTLIHHAERSGAEADAALNDHIVKSARANAKANAGAKDGPHLDDKAVAAATTDSRLECEEGKWNECYGSSRDFVDGRPSAKKWESSAQGAYAPVLVALATAALLLA